MPSIRRARAPERRAAPSATLRARDMPHRPRFQRRQLRRCRRPYLAMSGCRSAMLTSSARHKALEHVTLSLAEAGSLLRAPAEGRYAVASASVAVQRDECSASSTAAAAVHGTPHLVDGQVRGGKDEELCGERNVPPLPTCETTVSTMYAARRRTMVAEHPERDAPNSSRGHEPRHVHHASKRSPSRKDY